MYSSRLICPKRKYICLCTYSVYLSFCVYMWTVLQSARCVHVLESRTALVVLSLKARSFYGRKGYMCVILCTEFHILMSHKEHRRQEVLVLCLSPQTLSVFHRNRRLQAVLPPAYWGECRKQLEKQIVADRLSPSPLALTHDWTFTWMDEALPFFSCS